MPRLICAVCVSCFFVVPAIGLQLISVSEEIALGKQAQRQVKAQVPELIDSMVASYVQSIGRRLVARAGGVKYPYSFSVANYKEINAFALPGGPVWVHRGAIVAAQNEAQLAGVLAHEIAHIAERHAADQLTKNLVANGLLGLLGAMLGNDGSARAAQTAAQILAGGYMLKFSRDDEREADRVGARIMRQAGWDAREMVAFMEILRRQQGRDPGSVTVFLSSHPGPGERADLLRADLRHTSGGRRDTSQFRDLHTRLNRLPPARSMPKRSKLPGHPYMAGQGGPEAIPAPWGRTNGGLVAPAGTPERYAGSCSASRHPVTEQPVCHGMLYGIGPETPRFC